MKTKQYTTDQARQQNSLQIVCKNKWPSTAIFLSDLKGNIHVAHPCISELRLRRTACIPLDRSPCCQERGHREALLHGTVFMKPLWLANTLPCCSLLSPLWFADFWTSATHEGFESQGLTLLTPTSGSPGDSSLSSPTSLDPAALWDQPQKGGSRPHGSIPRATASSRLTAGSKRRAGSVLCHSPLSPPAAVLEKGSFIQLSGQGCVRSKAPFSQRGKGRAALGRERDGSSQP